MHGLDLLHDLAVIMVVAGLVTVAFHRLRQPVVLGYILAGFIVGPHTPPFPLVHDASTIRTLADIGVILLMFSLGQHFSLRKLVDVGATAVVAGVLEIALMSWLGYEVGRAFGWSAMDSLFLGAILSVSSTTIVVKALGDLGKLKERFAELIFGILIVEDVLAIAILALLSSAALSGTVGVGDVIVTLGKLSVFLATLLVIGLLIVPRLLRYVARYRSDEMLLVAVLGLCFGVSLIAAELGYSVALGAFLIGAVVAEAREAGRVEHLIQPVRDMFSAVFFVAIGMLIDPVVLQQHAMTIVVIAIAVIVGKVVTCTLGAFLAGNDSRTSLRVGMGLAQIGEFSFIIAQLGMTLGVTSDFLYPIAVAVSAITTLVTPYLIRSSDAAVAWLERVSPASFAEFLRAYQRWLVELGRSRDERKSTARRVVRKLALQVALDLLLITGLLIAAGALSRRPVQALDALPAWTGGRVTVAWVVAMIASLPICVHAFLKLRVAASVLAELAIPPATTLDPAGASRRMLTTVIWTAASAFAGALLLAIHIAVLPPWPVLATLIVILTVVATILWRRFIHLYSRAQLSLRETLSRSASSELGEAPLAHNLEGAHLETIRITLNSPAANRLIREVALRSRTGASIVGIDRGGKSIVNPGPDDELLVGDKVLVIGTADHLDAARRHLVH